MQKIVDYVCLSAANPSDLKSGVKMALSKGWQPFGAPSVSISSYEDVELGSGEITVYIQAVVKYAEDAQ